MLTENDNVDWAFGNHWLERENKTNAVDILVRFLWFDAAQKEFIGIPSGFQNMYWVNIIIQIIKQEEIEKKKERPLISQFKLKGDQKPVISISLDKNLRIYDWPCTFMMKAKEC